MRPKEIDSSQTREQFFRDLIDFILGANPEDDLRRDPIACRLGTLSSTVRSEIVNRVHNSCSHLFLGARRGLARISIYLLYECDANVGKKGVNEIQVTPLRCAAVLGHLRKCEVLVERGADVDVVSDTGSTALRRASYWSHSAVVKHLIRKGADVNRVNHDGRTCLMSSAQSEDLCFLILKGANVNARDSQFETVLFFAVGKLQFGTDKVLLEHDAGYLTQNNHGHDALRIACLEGCELSDG